MSEISEDSCAQLKIDEDEKYKYDLSKSCPVCNDQISGFHYGVMTCESCKGFFKRSIQNKKEYHCLENNDCSVDINNRRRCAYCRFQKCLSVGMKSESVRENRMRGGRGRISNNRSPNSTNITSSIQNTKTSSPITSYPSLLFGQQSSLTYTNNNSNNNNNNNINNNSVSATTTSLTATATTSGTSISFCSNVLQRNNDLNSILSNTIIPDLSSSNSSPSNNLTNTQNSAFIHHQSSQHSHFLPHHAHQHSTHPPLSSSREHILDKKSSAAFAAAVSSFNWKLPSSNSHNSFNPHHAPQQSPSNGKFSSIPNVLQPNPVSHHPQLSSNYHPYHPLIQHPQHQQSRHHNTPITLESAQYNNNNNNNVPTSFQHLNQPNPSNTSSSLQLLNNSSINIPHYRTNPSSISNTTNTNSNTSISSKSNINWPALQYHNQLLLNDIKPDPRTLDKLNSFNHLNNNNNISLRHHNNIDQLCLDYQQNTQHPTNPFSSNISSPNLNIPSLPRSNQHHSLLSSNPSVLTTDEYNPPANYQPHQPHQHPLHHQINNDNTANNSNNSNNNSNPTTFAAMAAAAAVVVASESDLLQNYLQSFISPSTRPSIATDSCGEPPPILLNQQNILHNNDNGNVLNTMTHHQLHKQDNDHHQHNQNNLKTNTSWIFNDRNTVSPGMVLNANNNNTNNIHIDNTLQDLISSVTEFDEKLKLGAVEFIEKSLKPSGILANYLPQISNLLETDTITSVDGELLSLLNEELFKLLSFYLETSLFKMVDWVNGSQFFKTVDITDQMQLLQSSWCELLLLSYAHNYLIYSSQSSSSLLQLFSTSQSQSASNWTSLHLLKLIDEIELYDKIYELLDKLRCLELDTTEFSLLKYLVLFNQHKHDILLRASANQTTHVQKMVSFYLYQHEITRLTTNSSATTVTGVITSSSSSTLTSATVASNNNNNTYHHHKNSISSSSANCGSFIDKASERMGELLLVLPRVKTASYLIEESLLRRYWSGAIPHQTLLTELLINKRHQSLRSSAFSSSSSAGGGAVSSGATNNNTNNNSSSNNHEQIFAGDADNNNNINSKGSNSNIDDNSNHSNNMNNSDSNNNDINNSENNSNNRNKESVNEVGHEEDDDRDEEEDENSDDNEDVNNNSNSNNNNINVMMKDDIGSSEDSSDDSSRDMMTVDPSNNCHHDNDSSNDKSKLYNSSSSNNNNNNNDSNQIKNISS